jgi:hypothetical protein
MKLLEVYESILKFASMEVDSNGFVNTVLAGKASPCMIGDHRLVLPTREQLKNFKPNDLIIFHPVMEDILKGETEIIQKLKYTLNVKLNFAIGALICSLLDMLASPDTHTQLDPEQSEIFKAVPEVDKKALVTFSSLMVSLMKTQPDRCFVNLFLKKGGTYQGVKYGRVGIVTFPFYRDLPNETLHKLRVKDREIFTKLFEYVLPGIDNAEEYNYGSSSNVAPMLEALLHTAAKIVERIHDTVRVYERFVESPEDLRFDLNWLEAFEDMSALASEARNIPVQPTKIVQEESPAALAAQALQVSQPQMPAAHRQMPVPPTMPPSHVPEPAPSNTGGGISFRDLQQSQPALAYQPNPLANQIMRQPAAMMQGPGPGVMVGYNQNGIPVDMYGMPVAVAPGMMMPGAMPGMMPGMVPGMMPGGYQHPNDPNRVPSWDRPVMQAPMQQAVWGNAYNPNANGYPYGYTR